MVIKPGSLFRKVYTSPLFFLFSFFFKKTTGYISIQCVILYSRFMVWMVLYWHLI